jgi:hypothetical protein
VSSTKAADEQKNVQEIVDKQQKARQSIEKTVKTAKEEYEEFHKLVLQGDKVVEEAVRDVKKVLPEELQALAAGVLAPQPLPDIAQAITYTNKLFATQVPAPAAEEKPSATNAVEAASAEKKPEDKKDEAKKDGKKADDKSSKADEKKAKADDKKSKSDDKKAESKKDGKKAAAKKDEEEDKDAEAEGKEVKKDDAPSEEPTAEEKPAENAVPAIALPQSVKNYEKVWADVCQYRAADIMLHGEVQKLLKKAKEADALTAQDEETATALAKLANELVEAYNRLKSEKWLIDAKRKVLGIDARARNYSGDTVKKIKLAIERHERALKEKREAEEKAAAAAAAAEKQKEVVEEERQKAQEEFDALAGDIKRIDWARCTRALTRLQDKMTTREGKEAVKDQLHKIEAMEGMQKHFVKHARGFGFKDKRGQLLAAVTKVDDKSLTIQKAKYVKGKPVPDKETRVEWGRFYGLKEKEYLGYMNQFINELVMKGQERDKTRVGPREWSDNMLGAALTLQHLYSEEKGVDKFIPVLVKKAVKGFEPSRKWATKWFPDIELEESDK